MRNRRWFGWGLALCGVLWLAACETSNTAAADATPGDTAPDGANPDAGTPDVAAGDEQSPDAPPSDVAHPDVPQGDARPGDAAGGDTPPSDTVLGDTPLGDTAPGDAGGDTVEPAFDPILAASLQAVIDEHAIFSADPGLTLSVRLSNGDRWSGAAGIAELQTGKTMTLGMGFRVGSNTKPFTAVVVLQLVEEGLLDLDDPLSDFLPEYTQWGAITVRQLLAMRSGIKDYLADAALMLDFVTHPGTVHTPAEILAYVNDEPLLFEPDSEGRYTNSNYLLLGLIVELLTGNRMEDEIRTRIIEPLGLHDTLLDMSGEVREDVARGYMDLTIVGQLFGVPPQVLAFIPEENRLGGGIVDCSYLFHPSLTWAAGALISSSDDMLQFMYALLNGELLGTELLAEMKSTTPVIILGKPVNYGLGMQVRDTPVGTAYGHGGLNFGYQASTYFIPDHGLTLSHMHNYLPEQSETLQNEILDLLVNGTAEARTVCPEPADFFFEPTDGPYVNLRFKGPINAIGADPLVAGVSYIVQDTADGEVPLYGWGSQARLKMSGLQQRLDIESYAPTNNSTAPLRLLTVSFDRTIFSALDEQGRYEVSADNPGAIVTTVADVSLDEALQPTRVCFTGVTDFNRPAVLSVCDAAEFTPAADATMKVFASVAITDDPDVVAATLAALSLPTCICPNGAGGWGACAE